MAAKLVSLRPSRAHSFSGGRGGVRLIGDVDALAGVHRDVRSLDGCRVGQRYRSDTVVVDREPLPPDSVHFLSLMDFNLIYELVEHTGS